MTLTTFLINLLTALVMGVLIGLERQITQHPAGLRTNALVAVGAAMFMSITPLIGFETSPTRIASYIISGIGFLAGGVILKEGINVRGLNTAATLWCTAAIGTLAGTGHVAYAATGTGVILIIHLLLKPCSDWIDNWAKGREGENHYRLRVIATAQNEDLVRSIILRLINSQNRMTAQGISVFKADKEEEFEVVADIMSRGNQDKEMQDVITRLRIDTGVSLASWKQVQSKDP
ncbi:MAG: MgtC/SapB family protein [Gemmataceae bacterium]|nr:MgtC/SapB family protein [Gemmataceae bacterium]